MQKYCYFLPFIYSVSAVAETDDFSDNNDNGWIRFDPISLATEGAADPVTFDPAGGVYRIAAPGSPAPDQVGPARAVAFRPTVYTDFAISVDIPAYDPFLTQAIGIIARVAEPPIPGQVDGYTLTYNPADDDIQITRVDDETPEGVSDFVPLDDYPLDATLRLVFTGVGDTFTGAIYDVSNPLAPLAETTGTDSTYPNGICGLTIFDNTQSDQPAGATFDNYTASDPGAAPIEIADLGNFEWQLTWLAAYPTGHIDSSPDLNTWTPLNPANHPVSSRSGGRLSVTTETSSATASRYYRLSVPKPDPEP